jgi:hypothetical protein
MKTTNISPRNHPLGERLAVWQHVHKKLLRGDVEYRKRFQSYLAAVIVLSGALLTFYLPYLGIELCGFWIDLAIILSLGVVIVYLSAWQIHFMNQRIRYYLQSKTGSATDGRN